MSLNINITIALLRNIHRFTPADFDIIGITKEQFDQLVQEDMWLRLQIPLVMQTFRNLIFATAHAAGYPKIVLPSEYIAAHVATLVAPANAYIACLWLQTEHLSGVAAAQLADRQTSPSEYEQLSGEKLFAQVCQCYDYDELSIARTNYRKRLGLAIDEAQIPPAAKGKSK